VKYYFLFGLLVLGICSYGQVRTLSFYTEEAKKNSPLLKGYQNQVLSNKLDSQLLAAGYKPQVNFLSNDSYAPVVNGFGYDEAITNIANVSGLIQARKDFISKGHLASLQKGIRLQSQAVLDTLRLSEKELVRTITEQYILAYSDMLAMDYANEVYSLLEKENEALKRLTRENVYRQTDYLAFVVTLQQQELNYLQAQILYNSDYLILNYLAGIVDTAIARLDEPMLKDTLLTDFSGTVFYQRYITDSLRIANEHTLVDYSYKPKFNVFADAGYNSSLQYLPYKNFGVSAGIGLTVPIYDGKQKVLKHSKLQIEESTRIANRDFFLNQYHQQTAQLYQQLHATDVLIEKINRQIEYTDTLIKADLKLLETGDVKLTDLILAINNYFNARNLLRQNNVSKLRIINQINYFNR
jgi:outer membrane protein TolC